MSTIGDISHRTKWILSKRYIQAIIVITLMLGGFLAVLPRQVKAVHNDNLFELGPGLSTDEGGLTNILGDGVVSNGPDWGDLFTSSGTVGGGVLTTFGGTAASFLKDDNSQKSPKDNTVFVVSSKNQDPLSAWSWGTSSVPPKDEFLRAYAYATINASNSHLVIYAGLERLNGTGSSHVDFQFFQDQVHLVNDTGGTSPPCGPSNKCTFAGNRIPGDILASADYTQGGTFPTISVYKWDGTTFVFQGSESTGCNSADTICGFTNAASIKTGSWSSGHIDANDFTEFGVDVTGLFGSTPCISTVFGATRSTGSSISGTLKDFAGPTGFPVCGAAISITPNAVNEVGATHTFNVNFTEKIGGARPPVPDGTKVTVTLTPANGAVVTNVVNNCASTGTVGGHCTVSFTSNSAGTVTGSATGTVVISGLSFTATTDGISPNSGPAVKRFVDAFVTIGPNAVNSINEPHTFTATVKVNDGLGGGFVNAANGTPVTITLVPVSPLTTGDVTTISNTCVTNPGTIGGSCSITFTSSKAGQVNGTATATPTVSGVTMTRTTNGVGQNSFPAVKIFVSGSIAWTKVDNAGNLLGGATFQYCRTMDLVNGVLVPTPNGPICNSVTDNSPPDQDSAAGQFLVTGLQLGTYTVHETAAPPGFEPDPRTATVTITIANPNVNITLTSFGPFVNQRPILKLTQFGYTNSPTGTPTAGVVSGTTVYTIQFTNYGAATASLSATLTVSVTGQGSGTLTCSSGCVQTFTATLAPNGSTTFTLTATYSNMADLAVITANLTASYTTNGLTRVPSGTPATISFTIQAS